MRRGGFTVTGIAMALVMVTTPARADLLGVLDYEGAVDALAEFAPELEPPSNSPNKDFVVGGFEAMAFPGWRNGISVHSGPAGENVKGHASATDPNTGTKVREEAVCLAVDGNLAAAGFRGVIIDPVFGTFDYEEIDVFRDGGPGGVLDGFEAFAVEQIAGAAEPEDCDLALGLALTARGLFHGNILVNDAAP